jgi:hypothetical protein
MLVIYIPQAFHWYNQNPIIMLLQNREKKTGPQNPVEVYLDIPIHGHVIGILGYSHPWSCHWHTLIFPSMVQSLGYLDILIHGTVFGIP